MKLIEKWERFARTELPEPVSMIFGEYFSEKRNPANIARANALLQERTARVEEQLQRTPFLAGSRMTAADITAAPWVYCGLLPPYVAASNPIQAFFGEHFRLGHGRERCRDWVRRVMTFDR
jgi:glutathione S-transferase